MTAILYLEHLGDADLRLLADVAGERGGAEGLLTRLRENPGYLDHLLGQPAVFAALFRSGEAEALLRASPFFAFAVLVQRAANDLGEVRFVEEWVEPGRRVPMFEFGGLQAFAATGTHRLFLAELLASYTHVASGSIWLQTSRGCQRRRYSELDPLRLLELAHLAPAFEQPGWYRRLGDLALFLTGVFPDYAARRFIPGRQQQRLRRALREEGLNLDLDQAPASTPFGSGLWLLEQLGRRSYALAGRSAEAGGVLNEVAEGFGQARRMLNFLTDRYLFPYRQQWFAVEG